MVQQQLETLRAFDHVRIIDAIESELRHEPLKQTRNRKPLEGLPPSLLLVAKPILGEVDEFWELRVVPWLVVYAAAGKVVHVLWVFRKDRETTDDALS